MERLAQLEIKTRPSHGETTAKDKDLHAQDALRLARKLVAAVAGWAIDHQVGLAAEGFEFVPPQPAQTSHHPHYLQQKAMADDHRHEKLGAVEAENGNSDPQFQRACLINLLGCNSGAWPGWLCQTIVNALEALEFGEVHPIFERTSEGNKRDLTERRLMLRALEMVQFRRTAYLMKKQDAQEEVAKEIGVGSETVKSWEGRLKGEIPLLVARALAFTENHASWVADSLKRERLGEAVSLKDREFHESSYNRQALELLGKEYRTALSRR